MVAYHGKLFCVKMDMLAQHSYEEYIGHRDVVICRGEVIEWRYETPHHFRTKDDKWFNVSDEVLLKHCFIIGTINDGVHFNNIANTEEIWRLKLFTWDVNGKKLFDELFNQICKDEEDKI